VFEGGFLGLDNIGVFDRSAPLPTGGYLEQADGTAWMVFFSQQMLRIAVELALHYPAYEEFVSKFFEHTMWIAGAMDRMGNDQDRMWDEEDGFFYDVLRLPNGQALRLKRSSKKARSKNCRQPGSTSGNLCNAIPNWKQTCTCRGRRVWQADACSPP
jgi:hypothetical protein